LDANPAETGEALPQGSVEVSDFPGSGWLGMSQTYSGPEENVQAYKRGGKSPEQAGLHYEGERKRTGRDTAGDVAQIVSDVTSTVNPITAVAGPMLTRAGKVATGQSDQGYGEALTEGATAAGTNLLLGGIGNKAAGAAGAGARKVAGETAGKVVETALSGAPALGKKALGAAAEKVPLLGKFKPFVGTAKAVGAGAGTAAAMEAPHGQLPTSTEVGVNTALEAIPIAGRMFKPGKKTLAAAEFLEKPHLRDKNVTAQQTGAHAETQIENQLAEKYGSREAALADALKQNKPDVVSARTPAEEAAAAAAGTKATVTAEQLKRKQKLDEATRGVQENLLADLKNGHEQAIEMVGHDVEHETKEAFTKGSSFKSAEESTRKGSPGVHWLGMAGDVVSPEQWTAETIRNPEFQGVLALIRKHLGDDFAHDLTNVSSELRRKHVNRKIRDWGYDKSQEIGDGLSKDLAAYFLSKPELGLSAAERVRAARVATGKSTAYETRDFTKIIGEKLRGSVTSPELKAAKMAHLEARAEADKTRAEYLASEAVGERQGLRQTAADLAAEKSRDELSAKLAEQRRGNAKLYEEGMKLGIGSKGGLNPGYAGRVVGGKIAGTPGYAVGAMLSGPIGRLVNLTSYGAGRTLRAAEGLPRKVQAAVDDTLRKVHINGKPSTRFEFEKSNGITRMALVNLAMKNPDVMAWLREQNNAVQK
jgi:hypothetical protein